MKRDFEEPSALKAEARLEMRRQLRAMSSAMRAEASLVICASAAQLPAFRRGLCIALFAPLPSEPDIRPLIEEAWAARKTVVLPRLWNEGAGPRLAWHAVSEWSQVVEPGPFGPREPDPAQCPRVEPAQLDCLFVPGLAFDRTGLRLGRGGGFYDRFLSKVPAAVPRFGLMFTRQQVERLPREPHDQALPAVVTEDGMLTFASTGTATRSIQPPPSTSSPT